MRRRPVSSRAAFLATVVALLAAIVTVALITPSAPARAGASGERTGGLDWQVSESPFSLSFLDHGRAVTAEAAGASADPGGRLKFLGLSRTLRMSGG